MKAFKPLVLAFSLVAFGAAYAADDAKKPASASKASPTTSHSADKSASSGSSANGSGAKKSFSELDKNHDGRLSRAEYEERADAAAGGTAGKSAKSSTAKSSKAAAKTDDKASKSK